MPKVYCGRMSTLSTHPWESAGLGEAPFRFDGHELKLFVVPGCPPRAGSSCDFCGTAIADCFWIRSTDGKRFKVGIDCVQKIAGKGERVRSDAEKAWRALATERRHAAQDEKIAAAAAALTDPDVRRGLAERPHPAGVAGKTLLDWVEWMNAHAGRAGKVRAAAVVAGAEPVSAPAAEFRRTMKIHHSEVEAARAHVEERTGGRATLRESGPVELVSLADGRTLRMVEVEVAGDLSLKLGEWTVEAVVEPLGDSALLRVLPGRDSPDLEEYRTADLFCEHCGTVRARKQCVVLRDEDGALLLVGSTCVAEYTGLDLSPFAAVGKLLSLAGELEEFCGRRGQHEWDLEEVAAQCACAVRRYGYTSKRTAEEKYCQSTADLVRRSLNKEPKAEVFEATDDDRAQAATWIAWARALPPQAEESFLANLRVIVSGESPVVGLRHVGFVAALCPAYQKHLEKEAAKKASGWFGEPGDKIGRKLSKKDRLAGATAHPALVAKLLRCITVESQWGKSILRIFSDAAGRQFVWFDSGCSSDWYEGRSYRLCATIKQHRTSNRDGMRQTALTRVTGEEV